MVNSQFKIIHLCIQSIFKKIPIFLEQNVASTRNNLENTRILFSPYTRQLIHDLHSAGIFLCIQSSNSCMYPHKTRGKKWVIIGNNFNWTNWIFLQANRQRQLTALGATMTEVLKYVPEPGPFLLQMVSELCFTRAILRYFIWIKRRQV